MDALSVREVNGKKWLEELTEKKFVTLHFYYSGIIY